MSLTDAQRTDVKRHLGFHAVAQSFFPLIEGFRSVDDILDALDATPATEASVVTILGTLATIETSLAFATNTNLKAIEVGSITLRQDETDKLWIEIRRWRRELSVLVGIPLRNPAGGAQLFV